MSKRTLIFKSTGGLLSLVCLNLAVAQNASANGMPMTNMSNGTGSCTAGCNPGIPDTGGGKDNPWNGSNGSGGGKDKPWYNGSNGSGEDTGSCTGGCTPDNSGSGGGKPKPNWNGSNGSGGGKDHPWYNGSNGSGGGKDHPWNGSNGTGGGKDHPDTNISNGTGTCGGKPCKPDNPTDNPDRPTDKPKFAGADGSRGNNSVSVFSGGSESGSLSYSPSAMGISQQMQQNLNALAASAAEASARVAQLQALSSQPPTPPADAPIRYSRVADANISDCGCMNPTAAAPNNSAELAAAKAAEAEANAALATAQAQARQFLETQKKNRGGVAIGTGFSPLW